MLSVKFGWNWIKTAGAAAFENLNIRYLKGTPNDPKLNPNDLTLKVAYVCSSLDRESQMFIPFALRSAVFNILHILQDFTLTLILKFQSGALIPQFE